MRLSDCALVCSSPGEAARRIALAAIFATLLGGCAGSEPAPVAPRAPAAAAKAAAAPALAPGHLARTDVDAVITKNGPPWVLSRILPEEVFREGKFVGWRLVEVPAEWTAFDMKPGDLVTRVNGLALERPEDVWAAWTSVFAKSDLTIDGEREGKAHQVVLHIDGEPGKELPASLRDDAPPPSRKPGARPTVVIDGSDEPIFSDSGESER